MEGLVEVQKTKYNQMIFTVDNCDEGLEISSSSGTDNIFQKSTSIAQKKTNISYEFKSIDLEWLKKLMESDECKAKIGSLGETLKYLKEAGPFEFTVLKRFKIIQTDKVSTLCVYWDDILRSFTVEYNEKFVSALSMINDEPYHIMLSFLLEHELNHVLRNHRKKTNDSIEENPRLANIAQDMVINGELKKFYRITPKVGINDRIEISGRLKQGVSLQDVAKLAVKHKIMKTSIRTLNDTKHIGEAKIVYYTQRTSNVNEDNLYRFLMDISKLMEIDNDDMDGVYIPVSGESVQELSKIIDCALEAIDKDSLKPGTRELVNSLKRPDCYRSSKISWRDALRKYLTKGLSTTEKYEANIPNARIEGQFGRDVDKPTPKRVLFAIDVSGSMGVDDYMWALSEIEKILTELRIKSITIDVVWWGSFVKEEEFKSYRQFKERCKQETPRLGGTLPDLAIKAINKKRKADFTIIFTDGGFSSVREKHQRDIIWCITADGTDEYIPKTSKDRVVKAD